MVPLKNVWFPVTQVPHDNRTGLGRGKKVPRVLIEFFDISHIERRGREWLGKFDWIQIQVLIEMIPHLPVRVGFLFPFTFINQSVFSTQWMIKKIFWSSRRLKRNSCFDGSAFMINQVRIITNQKWIKIRFYARQLGILFITIS